MLRIRFQDVFRATLPARSGNEGWIGVSPRGDTYHIVVPVDVQIAKGVMACNRPTDGTPFGGYSNWIYFRCPPYEGEGRDESEERSLRSRQAQDTLERLIGWLADYDISARGEEQPTPWISQAADGGDDTRPLRHDEEPDAQPSEPCFASCAQCGQSWWKAGSFLTDERIDFVRYRAAPDDFSQGVYVFAHSCGGSIEIAVSKFIRTRVSGKSLAGLHSCPGMCYYENSLGICQADCDGSVYRRVARRLKDSSTTSLS